MTDDILRAQARENERLHGALGNAIRARNAYWDEKIGAERRIAELEAERDAQAQEIERLKLENLDAEMAHGALHAIHELLDSGGVPRGTFADDHVRNLVAMYNNLKAERDASG
jgi:hypothetical protein